MQNMTAELRALPGGCLALFKLLARSASDADAGEEVWRVPYLTLVAAS